MYEYLWFEVALRKHGAFARILCREDDIDETGSYSAMTASDSRSHLKLRRNLHGSNEGARTLIKNFGQHIFTTALTANANESRKVYHSQGGQSLLCTNRI